MTRFSGISTLRKDNDITMLARLIAFDLDDTLAPSKSAISSEMADAICSLTQVATVAIISGGRYSQFQSQVLSYLQPDKINPANLHLLPTCGTQYYRHDGSAFQLIYSESLSACDRKMVAEVLEAEARRLGHWEQNVWGQVIEDRGSQVTFSALGQRAPVNAKKAWDPSGEKKDALREAVSRRIPNLEVRSGGSTSIDVTRKGIDKAFGMRKLSEVTGIPLAQMVFFGDRLDPSGNDYPVKTLGEIKCVHVKDCMDTLFHMQTLLAQDPQPEATQISGASQNGYRKCEDRSERDHLRKDSSKT